VNGEEYEETVEDLEERWGWFRRQRVFPDNEIPPNSLTRALEQKLHLGGNTKRRSELEREARERPVADLPDPTTARCLSLEGDEIPVRSVANPRPRASFGFASAFFEVAAVREFPKALLHVPLDPRMVATNEIDVSSARLFRWDAEVRRFRRVRASAPDQRGKRVSGRIDRPGVYGVIGLPGNPWTRAAMATFRQMRPWLKIPGRVRKEFLAQICRLILCPPGLKAWFGRGGVPPGTLPPFPIADRICEFCMNLDLSDDGRLPEGCLLPPQSPSLGCDPGQAPGGPPWMALGPQNLNGRIRALAFHPNDPLKLYAGAANGGVWVSADEGVTWSSLMQDQTVPGMVNVEMQAIGALAVHVTNPLNPAGDVTIYAGTGEPTRWPTYPGIGILKSTNSGASWTKCAALPTESGQPPKGISAIVVDPVNPQVVYVAAYDGRQGMGAGFVPDGGLYKSTDGGASWLPRLRPGNYHSLVMQPGSPQILYAGEGFKGVRKSINSGVAWTDPPLLQAESGFAETILVVVGTPASGAAPVVYAKLDETVFRSPNGGVNWDPPLGNHGGGTYGDWCSCLGIDPTDSNLIYAGGIQLTRGRRNPATGLWNWQGIDGAGSDTETFSLHVDQHAMTIKPGDPTAIYAANDGGVYRSGNQGTGWVKRSAGLTVTEFYDVGIGSGAPALVGGGAQDNGTLTTTGSATWTQILSQDGGYFVVDPTTQTIMYAEMSRLLLRKFTPMGQTDVTTGIDYSDLTKIPRIGVVAIHPTNALILYTGTDHVYRTIDSATSWQQVSNVMPGNGLVSAIAISSSNPKIVFVGTQTGAILRTANGGGLPADWSGDLSVAALGQPPVLPQRWITRLLVDPDDSAIVYVTFSGYDGATPATPGHCFRSADSGATWTRIDGATPATMLPDIPANGIAIDPEDPDTLYVATDIGIFRSTDGGKAWEPFDQGMPHCVVSDITVYPDETSLAAATFGRGMYRLTL
jgi:hypothetical protein